jgi:D-glycero-alpha-D-manno-heptose-7-phosphate kinase
MIISRTPFRISFFGGGTDFPAWYRQHGGAVLATAIDKYCYLTCRYLPPFFEHKYRILWSKSERCKTLEDITHPVIAHAVRMLHIEEGLEIHHDGDLPARSGMGSSSSFAVGLLHALYALKGAMVSREQLLADSLRLEQEILKDTVGSQDQTIAAYGGFNFVEFQSNGGISVNPICIDAARLSELNDHLMLFFTGISRTSSEISQTYASNLQAKENALHKMRQIVDAAIGVLRSKGSLDEFGRLLHESWLIKKSLSASISTSRCDDIYESARAAGALGGKVLGAGGGGFMLFFVSPENRRQIREKLKDLVHVPFRFEPTGSQIIYYTSPIHFFEEEQELEERIKDNGRLSVSDE